MIDIDFSKAALLEVDIQNDFCPAYTGKDGTENPEGALSIKHGDEVIVHLNNLAEQIKKKGAKILATQDWHPANHVSFASAHKDKKIGDTIIIPISDETVNTFNKRYPDLRYPIPAAIQQILWPVHCLQNSRGAAFHEQLKTEYIDFVFRKGYRKGLDSYSAFFENDRCSPTDLYDYLKKENIETLIIGGLATDYCVLYSVIDSIRLGFKTYVFLKACRGVDMPEGSIDKALALMEEKGAVFCSPEDFT